MNPTETTNKLNELLNADAEAMAFIFSIILALSLIYITKSKIGQKTQIPKAQNT